MEWFRLMIQTPESVGWPDEARKLLARLWASTDRDDLKFPGEIFHYRDDTPIKGLAPFRFERYAKGVSIVALGPSACRTLRENGHKISGLLGHHFDTCLPEHRYSGSFTPQMEERPYLTDYICPMIVLQGKGTSQLVTSYMDELVGGKVAPEAGNLIADILRKGIVEQAEFLGIDLPENFSLGDVTLLDGGKFLPIRFKSTWRLAAKAIGFRCSLDLHDRPWAAGYLKARGYGRILRRGRRAA